MSFKAFPKNFRKKLPSVFKPSKKHSSMTTTLINKPNLTSLTMMHTLKVSSKGQIVIPEDLRKKLNITQGTTLVLIDKENKIILIKEEELMKNINLNEQEEAGWLALAEQNLKKTWDNPEDEKNWSLKNTQKKQ